MKKTIAVILALVCMLSLFVACDSKKDENTSGDASVEASVEASSEASKESSDATTSDETSEETSDETSDESISEETADETSDESEETFTMPESDNDSSILGTWSATYEGIAMTYTFAEGNAFTATILGIVVEGEYATSEGKLYGIMSAAGVTEVAFDGIEYSVEGEELSLTEEGETVVLTKGELTSTDTSVEYTGETDEDLLGTWVLTAEGETVEVTISENGVGSVTAGGVTMPGTYMIEDGKLSVYYNVLGVDLALIEESDYSIDDNGLKVTIEGTEVVLTKK